MKRRVHDLTPEPTEWPAFEPNNILIDVGCQKEYSPQVWKAEVENQELDVRMWFPLQEGIQLIDDTEVRDEDQKHDKNH